MKKILFILPSYSPSIFGGVAVSMGKMIKKINEVYDVNVLTTNYKIKSKIITNSWTIFEGVKVYYVKSRTPALSIHFILKGIFEIHKYDQIHISSLFFSPNILFICYSRIFNKKIILSTHGEISEHALKIKSWKKKPYLLLIKIIQKNIVFRATSLKEFNEIKFHFPNSKVLLIPNFFENNEQLNLQKKNQFVFLGRISKIKMIENLIIACSLSRRFIESDYKLIIAGSVDLEFINYKNDLDLLVFSNNLTEKIFFIGEIDSREKDIFLSESKALFLISASENFGNVVIESLQQGTPVIASKGTPWEDLNNLNCGYWIDNKPSEIALKIDHFIDINKEEYNKMSINAVNFSFFFNINKLIPIWEKEMSKIK